MWSVWPERIELYLGPELALVRARQAQQSCALDFEPGTPLAGMLQEVSVRIGPWLGRRRWRAFVALSGAWCPAVSFEVPQGVSSRDELQALAQAVVEDEMQMTTPGELRTQRDAVYAGLASGCSSTVLQALQAWCADGVGMKGRLASVAPLWAVASQCGLARRHPAGVLVHEPSCVSVLLPRMGSQPATWWRSGSGSIDALSVENPLRDGALPDAMQRYLEALKPTSAPLSLSIKPRPGPHWQGKGIPGFLAPYWEIDKP